MSRPDRISEAVEFLRARFSASLLRIVFSLMAGTVSALLAFLPGLGCILAVLAGVLLYYTSSLAIAKKYTILKGRAAYTTAVFSYLAGWFLTYIIVWNLIVAFLSS